MPAPKPVPGTPIASNAYTANLVSAWLLNEGNGAWVDSVNPANVGTIIGVGAGVVGGAASFSGNGGIGTTNPPVLPGRYTFMTRFKPTRIDQVDNTLYATNSFGFRLEFAKVRHYSASATAASFANGAWADFTSRRDALGVMDYYVNGVFDSTRSAIGVPFPAGNGSGGFAGIGGNTAYPFQCFDGYIDYVFIFSVELSPADIAAITADPWGTIFATAAAPTVQTNAATLITTTTATLNGTIDPNGTQIDGRFMWGTNPAALVNATTPQDVGSGTAPVAYSDGLTGLTPGTTYYFRAVGEDPSLTDLLGAILSFTTLDTDPDPDDGGIDPTPDEPEFIDGAVSQPLVAIKLTDRGGITTPFAEVDLNDADDYEDGYKRPWVVQFERVSRGLSDRVGQLEHLSFGALLSDTTHYFRAVLAGVTTKYLVFRPLVQKIIDDEARRLEQTWRYIANGFVSSYAPRPDLQFLLQGSDWIKKKFSRKRRGAEQWQPTINNNDFPDAPQSVQNLAAPFWYGRLSDVGVGPILTSPTGVAGSVVGAAGAKARRYGVTFLWNANDDPADHHGETDVSFVDVAAAPDDQEFDPSRYVHLSWTAAGAGVGGIRVYGRTDDQVRLIATLPASATSYDDGIAGLTPLQDSVHPTANNTQTGDTGYGIVPVMHVGTDLTVGAVPMKTYLIARGAIKELEGVYLDGVRIPDSHFNDTNWLAPWFPNWPFAENFVDINGRRYTPIYGNSGFVDAEATSRITVNLKGIEAIGDTTGALLTKLARQKKHFCLNFMAPDTMPGTNWLLTSHEFPTIPGLGLVDTSSFTAVQTESESRVPGGYHGAGGIGVNGEFESAYDVLADFNVCGDFDDYFNRKGQYAISMEPRAPVPGVSPITDIMQIHDRSFEIVDEITTGFFNVHPYQHTKDHRDGSYQHDVETDDLSVLLHEQEVECPEWTFRFLRNDSDTHLTTLTDVIGRKKMRYRDPRRKATLALSYEGLGKECGDVFPVSHIEGIGAAGWENHDVRLARHEVEPTEGRVLFDAYDMELVYAAGFILGDRDALPPLWPVATPDQRRYGYLAGRDTGLFSTGEVGKTLR